MQHHTTYPYSAAGGNWSDPIEHAFERQNRIEQDALASAHRRVIEVIEAQTHGRDAVQRQRDRAALEREIARGEYALMRESLRAHARMSELRARQRASAARAERSDARHDYPEYPTYRAPARRPASTSTAGGCVHGFAYLVGWIFGLMLRLVAVMFGAFCAYVGCYAAYQGEGILWAAIGVGVLMLTVKRYD